MPRTGATALCDERLLKAAPLELHSTCSGLRAIPDTPSDVIAFWPKGPKYFRLYAAQWVATKSRPNVWRALVDRECPRRASLRIQSRLDAERRAVCRGSATGVIKAKGGGDGSEAGSHHPPCPAGEWMMAQNVCQTEWDEILIEWIRGWTGPQSLVNKPLVLWF